MIRAILIGASLLAATAAHAEIVSEYTEFDADNSCSTYNASDPEEGGDYADLACAGYKGYPVLVFYGDAREALHYGFPAEGELFPRYRFTPFNTAGPRIEWRIERGVNTERPVATIHRWFVADGTEGTHNLEILVVAKVASVEGRQSCSIGYVMASGNSRANEEARRIADENADAFDCASDEPEFADPAIRKLVSG